MVLSVRPSSSYHWFLRRNQPNLSKAKRDLPGKGEVTARVCPLGKARTAGFQHALWMSNQIALGSSGSPYSVPVTGNCGPHGHWTRSSRPGSCVEHLFGAAPWIGAVVNGVRQVTEL